MLGGPKLSPRQNNSQVRKQSQNVSKSIPAENSKKKTTKNNLGQIKQISSIQSLNRLTRKKNDVSKRSIPYHCKQAGMILLLVLGRRHAASRGGVGWVVPGVPWVQGTLLCCCSLCTEWQSRNESSWNGLTRSAGCADA